ncbi:MAG: hypothetical protein CMJ38_07995 [Phycisphaerae bacterium]|nr:hypothetical protein [Phycisphaerae bacterium]
MQNGKTESSKSISVIGLGSMGSGIARKLIDAGYQVSVWNRSRPKVDALVKTGAIACDSPNDALKTNAFVIVCLTDYAVWREIMETYNLQKDLQNVCIIQLTTGTIEEVVWNENFIQKHGGRIVDGAIMCYPNQLGTKDSSLLMAGESNTLSDCDPILRILAPEWTNLGDGIKQPTILSRALMAGFFSTLVAFLNSIAICLEAGISLDLFLQHSEKGDATIKPEKIRILEAIRDGNTMETQASIKAYGEGHKAVLSIAKTLGTNLMLQDAVQEVFQEGYRLGLSEQDFSTLVRVFGSKNEQECK